MKKRSFYGVVLFSLLFVLVLSCKSVPQGFVVPFSFYLLVSDVDESRKRAIDFESPEYFPSDWEAIENQYAAARSMPLLDMDEYQRMEELLVKTKDDYDILFRKTVPLYAQAREDEIVMTRDELIDTGFTRFYPGYLRRSDEIAITALRQYQTRDYYLARDTAARALNNYETLLTGARVQYVRQEAIDRGFNGNFENFRKADEAAQNAVREFETGDIDAARSLAENALFYFSLLTES
jgi:hypothetical protein